MSADLLAAVATVTTALDAEVIESDDIGAYAVELAVRGWPVLPLRGKVPAIPGGRGVLDASSDVDQVRSWWSGRYAGANIGARVPASLVVLDVDPRNGGAETLDQLVAEHGPLPATLTVWSGRGDGGRHLYYRRPFTRLTTKALPGVDLKTGAGYVVVPPSLHPATRQPYRWAVREPAAMPRWLQRLLTPAPVPPPAPRARPVALDGGSGVADAYSASASWCDLLPRHGWRLVRGDGDSDGSCWRHPAATAAVSATVRHGCLFVYSPNTVFPVTEAGDPHGVTRFRAYALLDHGGDLSAAARALTVGAMP